MTTVGGKRQVSPRNLPRGLTFDQRRVFNLLCAQRAMYGVSFLSDDRRKTHRADRLDDDTRYQRASLTAVVDATRPRRPVVGHDTEEMEGVSVEDFAGSQRPHGDHAADSHGAAAQLTSVGRFTIEQLFEEVDREWHEQALCAQTDPEAFFPEKGGSTREAKRICKSCTVRDECLEYALEHDERFGIWGGLSERERRRLKKDLA